MAIREKLRKKFSRGSSSTSSSEASSTMGDDTTPKIEFYRPGEKIPYKYRRPVDKAHKEKLESYTFASAWNDRRKSFASEYSPMASRLPSRRCSTEFRRSFQASRSNLHAEQLAEGSDEDTLTSNSTNDSSYRSTVDGFLAPNPNPQRRRESTPFNPEDLTIALQRSRLG